MRAGVAAAAVDGPLSILYRDDALVAIDKPPGLLVHRSSIAGGETRFALQLLRDQLGQHVYPVHRLDRPTSGLLLFALSGEHARLLARQFERQQVAKDYLAVVRGLCPPRGTIAHPLRDLPDDRSGGVGRVARSARTRFECLATAELPEAVDRYPTSRYSLVKLSPTTGRRHQLRRHMKHIAHPIIGDATYGKGVHNRFFRDRFGCARLLLACTGLTLTHPASGERLRLTASPGIGFVDLMAAMGWSSATTTR